MWCSLQEQRKGKAARNTDAATTLRTGTYAKCGERHYTYDSKPDADVLQLSDHTIGNTTKPSQTELSVLPVRPWTSDAIGEGQPSERR